MWVVRLPTTPIRPRKNRRRTSTLLLPILNTEIKINRADNNTRSSSFTFSPIFPFECSSFVLDLLRKLYITRMYVYMCVYVSEIGDSNLEFVGAEASFEARNGSVAVVVVGSSSL